MMRPTFVLALFIVTVAASAAAAPGAAPALVVTPVALPGGPPVSMDYLAFEPVGGRVWVPAGNTGKVDVIDVRTRKVTAIDGFETAKVESPRGVRILGPSSATVGDGVIYIGNRANKQICAVDAKTLVRGACATLASMPDGLAYVATTKEVWVTTPRDQTLTILDVGNPAKPIQKQTIKLPGDPEGYAVDATAGIFFTNLEDQDRTLAIDVRTRKITATWKPECGKEGPRGLALDAARKQLFVACTGGVVALSTRDGGRLGRLSTGEGVDNIDYAPKLQQLYVASGRSGTLTIARVSAAGALELAATVPTAERARVVVVDVTGTAYVADSAGGRVLVVPAR